MKLTAENVRQVFHYNPETGVLTYNKRPRHYFNSDRYWKAWNTMYGNREVSVKRLSGGTKHYYNASFNQKNHKAHRVIFLYMMGRWPEMVDHIDGNGLNNKWENLREATREDNQRNMRKMSSNTSGVTGVSYDKRAKRWVAMIWDSGKAKFLGQSKDFLEAVKLRKDAEVRLGYHENHGLERPRY